MRLSVQLFAFNTTIAGELKARVTEEALAAPLRFKPSPYQEAIFGWVAAGSGSAIIRAVAGSGKTTTVVSSLRYIPGLQAKDVRASTFHSVGYSAVTKHLGRRDIKADPGKVKKIARAVLGDLEHEAYADFAVRLVALAKGAGVGVLIPDEMSAWYALISHHDLYLDTEEATEGRAIEIGRQLLAASNDVARSHGDIDFDDMLYLPLLWKLRLWQNDWVIIDEAQDTSPVRRAIAKLALRPGGRLIAVGDERQAIYGFTGASNDAMALIQREFRCAELPLTVSYRCPLAVAERVRGLVPYFEVPENAIPGSDLAVSLEEGIKLMGPRDAVLCRQTAPLIALAFALIARGVGCHVLGREIADGLVKLIKRQKASGIDGLLTKLEGYRDREVAKHTARGEEGKAEAVADRVACVVTVVDSLSENERTIPALIRKLESIFSDTNGVLTLSTVHRVKGKEYPRVFILAPGLMPSRWARQEWQFQQELNLQYVAWTRAMDGLYELVGTEPNQRRPA